MLYENASFYDPEFVFGVPVDPLVPEAQNTQEEKEVTNNDQDLTAASFDQEHLQVGATIKGMDQEQDETSIKILFNNAGYKVIGKNKKIAVIRIFVCKT